MKQNLFLFLLIIGSLFLTACGQNNAPATPTYTESETVLSEQASATDSAGSYHKITAAEAKTMMEEKNVLVVDVRTEEEYAEKHIEGAILLPLDTIQERQPEQLPDTEAVLLVYCRTGVRSKAASRQLLSLGYQNVYDMGGIADWPFDTVSGEE